MTETGDTPQALLDEAARQGLFTSGRAVVLLQGRPIFVGGVGVEDTCFDLASLTKVLATTALFARLWEGGAVSLETPLAQFFPNHPVSDAGVTLGDLLAHRSGLPAWRPFFVEVLRRYPGLLSETEAQSVRGPARAVVVDAAKATPLERPRGALAVYSDVGFLLLGEALAQAGGAPLDVLFTREVARPLGLTAHFRPLGARARRDGWTIARTGLLRPREPAPGQANTWGDLRAVADPGGEVDDDNAWTMGGVAGHAGLFGTALDVARFGSAALEGLQGSETLASPERWERLVALDAATPGSTRTFGFDTPSVEGSSAGRHIGKRPPGAFGHLGFTGTSLWVDRARTLVVALCTNRTWSGRQDERIKAFRPRFHDAVVESLGL